MDDPGNTPPPTGNKKVDEGFELDSGGIDELTGKNSRASNDTLEERVNNLVKTVGSHATRDYVKRYFSEVKRKIAESNTKAAEGRARIVMWLASILVALVVGAFGIIVTIILKN